MANSGARFQRLAVLVTIQNGNVYQDPMTQQRGRIPARDTAQPPIARGRGWGSGTWGLRARRGPDGGRERERGAGPAVARAIFAAWPQESARCSLAVRLESLHRLHNICPVGGRAPLQGCARPPRRRDRCLLRAPPCGLHGRSCRQISPVPVTKKRAASTTRAPPTSPSSTGGTRRDSRSTTAPTRPSADSTVLPDSATDSGTARNGSA